ncbi:unnamed protein product [Urochloa humidicola]
MSSSYHPQSDGQTERTNQTMETFLRCFVNACPNRWLNWLSQAEFWYNNCEHSAVGTTPFKALYGYEPKHFGISVLESVTVPSLSDWLHDRQVMTDLIKQHLHRAKLCMKKQADQHRSERQFSVGEQVFLKLQPYVQTSVAPRSNQKLSFKYFGPFDILERIGQVAYKLKLPPTSSFHPVFHVSQLKKAVIDPSQVSPLFPDDIDLPRVPEVVLQRREVTRGGRQVNQVLIKWSLWPESMATWETLEDLRRRFPQAPAWGQAGFQEGEIVSSAPVNRGSDQAVQVGPRQGSRLRKPKSRVVGSEWVNV